MTDTFDRTTFLRHNNATHFAIPRTTSPAKTSQSIYDCHPALPAHTNSKVILSLTSFPPAPSSAQMQTFLATCLHVAFCMTLDIQYVLTVSNHHLFFVSLLMRRHAQFVSSSQRNDTGRKRMLVSPLILDAADDGLSSATFLTCSSTSCAVGGRLSLKTTLSKVLVMCSS